MLAQQRLQRFRLNEDGAGLTDRALELCRQAAGLIARIIDEVRDGRSPATDVGDLPDALRQEYSEYVLRAEAAEEALEETGAPIAVGEPIAILQYTGLPLRKLIEHLHELLSVQQVRWFL